MQFLMQLFKVPFEVGLVKPSPPASLVLIATTDPAAGDHGEPAASSGPREPGRIISGLLLIKSEGDKEREGWGKSC